MSNVFYVLTIALFLVGFWIVLVNANLIKKIIGITIMESAAFLFFIAAGYVRGAAIEANPIITRVVITGICVTVAVTAVALALVMKLHEYYGTVDINEIVRVRRIGQ